MPWCLVGGARDAACKERYEAGVVIVRGRSPVQVTYTVHFVPVAGYLPWRAATLNGQRLSINKINKPADGGGSSE